MKNKTYRFAAALAILLALLVFVAPVGAAGDLKDATNAAAEVNGQYYSTLEYAVNNITTSGTIVVQNNVELTAQLIIPAGKTIILDLNGHTISMTDSSSTGCYMIKNSGDLTITDGSTEKTGKLSFISTTPDSSYGYSTSTVGNAGKLTVESGIIESNTNGGASYAIDNFWYTNDVETIINGGTITSKGIAIRQVPFSTTYKNTLTITDGTISADTGAVQTHAYSTNPCLAEVTITGGELTGTYAYYTYYYYADGHKGTSIEISGGTFTGYLYIYNGNAGSSSYNFKNVKITDGTFNSGAWVDTIDANNDYFSIKSITGGLFPTGVDASYIKDGYHCIGNEDDGYEVTPDVTVTANPSEGGTVSFSYETTADGTEITLTANPNNGYKFDMWDVLSGGVTITNDKFTMPENAVSIKAVFLEDETETPPAGDDDTPTEPVIAPSFEDANLAVEETESAVTVTVPNVPEGTTSNSEVWFNNEGDNDQIIITDTDSGAKMTITFSGNAVRDGNSGSVAGTVDDVSVTYNGDTASNPEIEMMDADAELVDDEIIITMTGSSFSTYAVGIAPASEGGDVGTEDDSGSVSPGDSGSGSSGKGTSSGDFQYYPRSVPADGIIDFGTSPVVTGMEVPVGSSGTVTLNTKPTFAMPENGFYIFEIDAPGYNNEAKINGGIAFKISIAKIEETGWTENDVVLFHGTVAEDGKITWEALPTNLVKVENGIAYYKAAINGCSPFYIGFVEDGSIVNTEVVDPVTPPTETPDVPGEILPEIPGVQDDPEEPSSPAPVLGVLAALGAAVVLRRK